MGDRDELQPHLPGAEDDDVVAGTDLALVSVTAWMQSASGSTNTARSSGSASSTRMGPCDHAVSATLRVAYSA